MEESQIKNICRSEALKNAQLKYVDKNRETILLKSRERSKKRYEALKNTDEYRHKQQEKYKIYCEKQKLKTVHKKIDILFDKLDHLLNNI